MNDVPWSLHLLAELLSVFTPDADDVVSRAVERVAEAVDAELAAVVDGSRLVHDLGAVGRDRATLAGLVEPGLHTVELSIGPTHVHTSPLGTGSWLVVGRTQEPFDVEERALLRAMARTLDFLQQLVDAVAAERQARSMAERHAAQTTHLLAVLRERNRLLDRLAGIQRAIGERAPTEQLLATIVDGLVELTGGASAVLYVDDGRGAAVPVASTHEAGPVTDGGHPVRRAVATAQPCWGPVDRDGRPAGWCLAAPVHRDGTVVGALALAATGDPDADEDRPVRREVFDALSTFADHASLALNDASARAALDSALSEALHRATHDVLTGLPNRAMVVDHLGRRLRAADLLGRIGDVTVLFVDVDRFKQVNDAQGHAAGDRFLQALAGRLRTHVREGDVVGRLAGDEFVVVTEQPDPPLADELAARLVRLLAEPVDLGGRATTPSVSIGVARATPGDDAESLLANADLAMYRAKQSGRGRHEHYDRGLRVAAQHRARAEHELRRALAEGQLEVHYQPVVRLADLTVVGLEALVRWRRGPGDLVLPGEFIPVAEETGLIAEIDAVVLRTACAQVAPWRTSDGTRPVALSVNLSAQRFSDPALPDAVAAVVQASGLDPGRLFLEITESTMMEEHEATGTTMARLVDLGVQLAVDEFGTGYSSLRYLRRFPVGMLKIDRSFVDGLGTDHEDEAIVGAVCGLAGALGVGVVGEGVETDLQAGRLLELGCAFGQGFLYGRPADAATTEQLLRDGLAVAGR